MRTQYKDGGNTNVFQPEMKVAINVDLNKLVELLDNPADPGDVIDEDIIAKIREQINNCLNYWESDGYTDLDLMVGGHSFGTFEVILY